MRRGPVSPAAAAGTSADGRVNAPPAPGQEVREHAGQTVTLRPFGENADRRADVPGPVARHQRQRGRLGHVAQVVVGRIALRRVPVRRCVRRWLSRQGRVPDDAPDPDQAVTGQGGRVEPSGGRTGEEHGPTVAGRDVEPPRQHERERRPVDSRGERPQAQQVRVRPVGQVVGHTAERRVADNQVRLVRHGKHLVIVDRPRARQAAFRDAVARPLEHAPATVVGGEQRVPVGIPRHGADAPDAPLVEPVG